MRFQFLALVAMLAPLSVGVPPSAVAEQITFGGATRNFELYRPVRAVANGQNVPLMVVLAETGNTAARVRRTLGLDAIANREGFAVAYVEALNGSWNDGRNRESPQRTPPAGDDVSYIRTLVQQLNARGLGSPGDTAIVGIDGGGMMAYRLACETNGVFSSYAALLANMSVELRKTCQPKERKPMLMLVGTTDTTMPYGGGKLTTTNGIVLSADATFQFWGQINGCSAGEGVTLPDVDQTDGTRIEVLAGRNCAVGADATLYRVVGGGHQLPSRASGSRSTSRGGARTNHDVDTAEIVWQFASGQRSTGH